MGAVTKVPGFIDDPFFNRTIYPLENTSAIAAFSYNIQSGAGSAVVAGVPTDLSQYQSLALNNEGQDTRFLYGIKADGSSDDLGRYLSPFEKQGIFVTSQTKVDSPNYFILEKEDKSGYLVFSNSTLPATGSALEFTAGQGDYMNPVCFAAGTRIRTSRGEVVVEDLQVGDFAITSAGERREIRWIGHRVTNCARHPRPEAVWPVRVLANAFGDGLPARDLWLSPDHSVRVSVLDEVLIPIKHLINDATVAQVEVDEVTYWHVELDSHDIIFAEGMPAESFLDTGVRSFFENGGGFMGLHPDFSALSLDDFCLPLIQSGPIVDAVRTRLLARAAALGWTLTDQDDLHIVADDVVIRPEREGAVARFTLPAHAKAVHIVSRSFVPERVRVGAGDGRRLGLPLHSITVTDQSGVARSLPIDHMLLSNGFSYVQRYEGDAWRWTTGAGILPAVLWAGAIGEVTLHIEIAHKRGTLEAWAAPTFAAEVPVASQAAAA